MKQRAQWANTPLNPECVLSAPLCIFHIWDEDSLFGEEWALV